MRDPLFLRGPFQALFAKHSEAVLVLEGDCRDCVVVFRLGLSTKSMANISLNWVAAING